MQKNNDGSVILTKEELEEVNKAYQSLYHIISGGPSFIGDYLESKDEYINVVKWQYLLNDEEFDLSDWT